LLVKINLEKIPTYAGIISWNYLELLSVFAHGKHSMAY